jgi:hypothetical protein
MKPRKPDPAPALPLDPVGDALADCYLFLLRKLKERRQAGTSPEVHKSEAGAQPAESERREASNA